MNDRIVESLSDATSDTDTSEFVESQFLVVLREHEVGTWPATTEEVIELVPGLVSKSISIDENYINLRRLDQLERQFARELLTLIQEESFEYGFASKADILVKEQMEQNLLATKTWLGNLFVSNFNNVPALEGLLRLIARIEYSKIHPEGPLMASAALSHRSIEIQECGVRAFEGWGNLQSLHILENLQVATDWLQEYVDRVVRDLRKQYNVRVAQENQ